MERTPNSHTASILADKRIVFVRSATIVHPARTSIPQFARWMFIRGRAKRQSLARHQVPVGLVSSRLTSYGRIVQDTPRDPKVVLIVPLLVASIVIQQVGFAAEWMFSPRR